MIIHLTGPDTYRSAQRLRELRNAFIAKHDPKGFNTVTLDGDMVTPEALHGALTSTGFFSSKRFVALDRYSPQGLISPEQLLAATTSVSAKDSDVIFVVRDLAAVKKAASASTKKKKTTTKKKTLESPQLLHEKLEAFPVMSDSESVIWVKQMVKDMQGMIIPSAVQRLVAMCHSDSWRMAAETEKLVAHNGGTSITVADVESMVKTEASSDIFALTDALGHRQRSRVLELVHRELASGTNEFSLIATLAGHVRNLYHVQLAQARGATSAAIATELSLHPFVVQKAIAQTKQFTGDELRDLHHRLLLIDQDLKTSPLDAETLYDLLAIER